MAVHRYLLIRKGLLGNTLCALQKEASTQCATGVRVSICSLLPDPPAMQNPASNADSFCCFFGWPVSQHCQQYPLTESSTWRLQPDLKSAGMARSSKRTTCTRIQAGPAIMQRFEHPFALPGCLMLQGGLLPLGMAGPLWFTSRSGTTIALS